ncbi:NADP-dependent oxidoreductase [Rhodobacteraceae bacterium CCMM004]|nr:NADP-dependent oxidoreductase [Rhodobacteraceae bacterium CCMM004]
MTETARTVTLAKRPEGVPGDDCFALEDRPLGDLAEGHVRVRVIWLSLDPYMRGRMNAGKSYSPPVEIGEAMGGQGVGEVIGSRAEGFAEGDIVTGMFGWVSHADAPAGEVRRLDPALAPVQTALGVLGMPGLTAWVGVHRILEAQAGETAVVSAATGAVGSVAGQLARRHGLRAVGVAGGPEKCAYAEEELGYDACLDHRAPDLRARLGEAAPDGVDGYFENVGGVTLEAVLPALNDHARIALCGVVAWYNGQGVADAMPLPAMWRTILVKRLRVQGFIIYDHFHRFPEFLAEVGPLVADGTLRYRESVTEGLENAPAAFRAMLEGGNFGKTLVRVGPDA